MRAARRDVAPRVSCGPPGETWRAGFHADRPARRGAPGFMCRPPGQARPGLPRPDPACNGLPRPDPACNGCRSDWSSLGWCRFENGGPGRTGLRGWRWPARVSTHDRWAGSDEAFPGGWVSSARAARGVQKVPRSGTNCRPGRDECLNARPGATSAAIRPGIGALCRCPGSGGGRLRHLLRSTPSRCCAHDRDRIERHDPSGGRNGCALRCRRT
jgi:hypothetical protein